MATTERNTGQRWRQPFEETMRRVELVPGGIFPDPDKHLGQNFLISRPIIDKIARFVQPGATVIEVGPGLGVLTEALADRAERVIGIELDPRFSTVLSDVKAHAPNTSFVNADALDWRRFIDVNSLALHGRNPQVISNLPFDIAGKFMASLVGAPIENAVFFLGNTTYKELNAGVGSENYGHISVISQFFNKEKVADVETGCFFPKPETTGKIVVMTRKPFSELEDNTATNVFAHIIHDTQRNDPQRNGPLTVLQSISEALNQRDESAVITMIHAMRRDLSPTQIRSRSQTEDLLQQTFFNMQKTEVRELGEIVQRLV
jgi:16S rRNA A1518/A1519 N6-dimethyltransferase RsmA/KsgA/DIM1 with predicted DNA glycosylase/AP lyase activity